MEKNKFLNLKNVFYCLMKAEKYHYPEIGEDVAMHTGMPLVLVMIKC